MTTTFPSMKNFDEKNEENDELQLILPDSVEPSANLNAIFNPPPGIDLHQVTRENLPLQYANLREYVGQLMNCHRISSISFYFFFVRRSFVFENYSKNSNFKNSMRTIRIHNYEKNSTILKLLMKK